MLCSIELIGGCSTSQEFSERTTADGMKALLFKTEECLKGKKPTDYLFLIKNTEPKHIIHVEFSKIINIPCLCSTIEAKSQIELKLVTRAEASLLQRRDSSTTISNSPIHSPKKKEFEKMLGSPPSPSVLRLRCSDNKKKNRKGVSVDHLFKIDDYSRRRKEKKTLSGEIKRNKLPAPSEDGFIPPSALDRTENLLRADFRDPKGKKKKQTLSVGGNRRTGSVSVAFKQFFSPTMPRAKDEMDVSPIKVEMEEEARFEDWADESESELIAPNQFAFHTQVGDRALLDHEFICDNFLLEVPDQMNLYKLMFSTSEHSNYIGTDDKLGPVVISLMFDKKFGATRCIIRVPARTENFQEESTALVTLKNFLTKSTYDLTRKTFHKVKNEAIQKDIAAFDESHLVSTFKFGVLYCKEGQTTEDEWFGNEHGSPAFDEFLDILGPRIQLEGWDKYRGGLDVRGGTTGKESIFVNYPPYEIMFHVSTLLPYQDDDEQKIERKRHLGNDIVVIIFAEGDFVFTPEICKSVFNHVYIVVKPCNDDPECYTIGVTIKDGVKTFGPSFPFPAILHKSMLQKFLLMKMLNAEWAAYGSLDFSHKFKRTRKMQLASIVKDFSGSD